MCSDSNFDAKVTGSFLSRFGSTSGKDPSRLCIWNLSTRLQHFNQLSYSSQLAITAFITSYKHQKKKLEYKEKWLLCFDTFSACLSNYDVCEIMLIKTYTVLQMKQPPLPKEIKKRKS